MPTKMNCALVLAISAAFASCKTPASRGSSLLSKDQGRDSDDFFASQVNCQARMGFRLNADMSIAEIDLTSYADVMLLQVGDRVKTLNDESVDSPDEFEKKCLDIGENRPALWRYGVERPGNDGLISLGGKAVAECDYLSLIGCAPLPPRDERD